MLVMFPPSSSLLLRLGLGSAALHARDGRRASGVRCLTEGENTWTTLTPSNIEDMRRCLPVDSAGGSPISLTPIYKMPAKRLSLRSCRRRCHGIIRGTGSPTPRPVSAEHCSGGFVGRVLSRSLKSIPDYPPA